MRALRLLPLPVLLTLLTGCSGMDFGNPTANYPGTPRPFPTAGVAVSNACGLLSPDVVYAALGTSALTPRTGSEVQPPNCTWVTPDTTPTYGGEVVLEVSSERADVARVRDELTPPLAGDPVPGIGTRAVIEPGPRVVALVDDRTVLVLRLFRGSGVPATEQRATAVRLAKLAVHLLGPRRPAGGQLLATPAATP